MSEPDPVQQEPDDIIINRMREHAIDHSAVDVALLLDSLLLEGIQQSSLVTYFKRAFPEIPLRTLLESGDWYRATGGKGPRTDAGFAEQLEPWMDQWRGKEGRAGNA
jgi:hypothetical protein